MLKCIVFGGGFAFAAAVQPGPLQAFLLSKAVADGWKRTLPAAFAPLLSDGPIALLVLLMLKQLPKGMERFLQVGGGFLLLYLAVSAFRQWRRPPVEGSSEGGSAPRTLAQAVAVNLTNPNPYLGWSLVLGPKALAEWQQSVLNGIVLIASFYGTMVVTLALTIMLFSATRYLSPRARSVLLLLSSITLALLGLVQLYSGVQRD